MIQKKKILIAAVILLLLYIFTTNYILFVLNNAENEVFIDDIVSKKILEHLEELSPDYFVKPILSTNFTQRIIENIKTVHSYDNKQLWATANSWVTQNKVVNFNSSELGSVIHALKNAKIIKADLDQRGTQLKLLLTLQGGQLVIFKPKWYEIDKIIEGPVYAGKDRIGSEILGFYMSILMKKPLTPISAERNISLTRDVIPVATKKLIETSFKRNNKTCIYGKCLYCKKEDPICESDNFLLTGAVIFNIRKTLTSHRNPWQRTYKKTKRAPWQENANYCNGVKTKLTKKRLYDLVDISIFDFLIQNGDRHHYETMDDAVLILDNGKGLGNPFINHIDILAPLYQCSYDKRH
ncbi:glycosaminoglycan xylosylkinase homolog isoform X2 [Aethina tumida]|uniref:glycosaminoglycan xylosylkinase homolog isoform X2 n=1 Tax=Aethina tumida TaxID=116153 RepID=UPI0021491BC4|nr:glycosaminoglycan xylosylkinase homolog isoform X2 [Aethina tumida]